METWYWIVAQFSQWLKLVFQPICRDFYAKNCIKSTSKVNQCMTICNWYFISRFTLTHGLIAFIKKIKVLDQLITMITSKNWLWKINHRGVDLDSLIILNTRLTLFLFQLNISNSNLLRGCAPSAPMLTLIDQACKRNTEVGRVN